MLTVMNIPTTRNYFGVKHGKGPSDRAGAHFKNFVSGVVRSKKAMLVSVKDLADYSIKEYDHQVKCNGKHECVESLKSKHDAHNLTKVIYTEGKIPWPNSYDETVTYKGTRNIHTIRNTGLEGIMEKRDMSCCCPKCMYDEGECVYPEYADVWTVISVVGRKHLKNVKLGSIQIWRVDNTVAVRSVQKARSNVVPNSSSEKNLKKSSARCKLKLSSEERTNDSAITEKLEMNDEGCNVVEIESLSNESMSNESMSNDSVSKESTEDSSDSLFDFDKVPKELCACRTYWDVHSVVRRYIRSLPNITLNRKYRQTVHDVICAVAILFYPNDHLPNLVPNKTYGDGNCFFRAVSHAVFGTEERHVEICVRIVFEAVLNEALHLSSDYLSLGMKNNVPARPNLRKPSSTIVTRYCLYSGDDSIRHLRLNEMEIQHIYRQDIM